MNIKDIREGSVVHCLANEKFGRVKIERFNIDGEIYDAIADVEFTEKWLTKLGLRGQVINGYAVSKNPYMTGNKFSLFKYSDAVDGYIELCGIRSVSHCINLFYDLTGYEFDSKIDLNV